MEELKETESSRSESLELPQIPEGYTRLTHFTSEEVAKKFINGDDFFFKHISTTVDAFSDNESVIDLIKKGKVGAFSRDPFGDSVVLIDLENEEFKKRYRIGYCQDDSVPNHNILGYVNRNEPSTLHRNPSYNASENILTRTPVFEGKGRRVV